MDDSIVERSERSLPPTDRVLVLGDVAMGKIDRTLGAASQLRGYKALLAGNHDRCTALHGRKAVGWDERYRRDGGFAEIHQGASASTSMPNTERFWPATSPTGGLNRRLRYTADRQ